MDTKLELVSNKIRYTSQREAILDILKESELPLTINQICDRLTTTVDLSTVYRALDLFEQKGLVIKTTLQEPLSNVYDYNRHLHQHHLICIICKKIEVIEECPIHQYEQDVANQTGYLIERHQLDLYGVCPTCQKNN